MSIPINTDNSVQLSYSSFPFTVADIDNYATSNFVSNVSNALRTAINTKQDTLTAGTNLLGVGTSITAIDYTKVSVNKPTNFQADWTTTVINKPTIYTQSQIDTFLNAKQNTLTAGTTLLGTGGSITGINYNTIINKPTYSLPLNSNATTNTISISLSDYYNQTQVNGLITNTSNYASNISNVLKANIDTKDNILSFTSPLIRTVNTITFSESAITTLTNFYNKTEANNLLNAKQATLSFTSPLVNTANTINFNESAITTLTNFYNKTEANARYLQLAGGDLTGTLNIKTGTSVIHFGTRIIDNLLTLWGDGTSTYGIGINNATLRYNVPTNTTHRFYTGTTNTVTIDGSGNVGIGITNPFASLSIGTPAAVSDGTLTISKNYTAGGFRNFKIGLDASFNFCIGDFGSAVSGNTWRPTDLTINWNTGNIGIGISGQSQKLYVNGSVYITAATTINAALTATSFSGDGANITNVPYSAISGKPTTFPVDTSIYYNKTEVNGLITNTSNYASNISNILKANIDTKQNILSFTSPLVNTTNTITFNESAITTLTNFYNKTDANARYLQLAGGTMSAGANIITTGNIRAGSFTAGETTYQLLIGPPTATAPASIQTILQGSGYNQNLTLQAAGGNVGIGTSTNINSKLLVNGNTIMKGILNIHNGSPFATANYTLQNGSLIIGDTLLDYGGGTNWNAGNAAGLMLECSNTTEIVVHDSGNRLASLMYYTGNTITIGRDMGWNALSSVTMYGNSITTSYVYAGGTTNGLRIAGFDYGNTIYQDAITISGQPADIGFTLRNTNSFVFKSLTSPNYIEICRMNTSGLSVFGNQIYNYLFNNTGGNHGDLNNFDNVSHFGYKFIQGNVNAPNTLYAQWYSWYIGLGINYPATGANSYGAQFGLPRNTNNPYLYIRYKENNTWGLWNSIRVVNADQCLGLAAGNQTISGALTVTEYITCKLFSVDYVGYDDVGVLDVSGINQNNSKTLRQIWNSFTAFHRCFVDDELFDIDNPQEFKDDYMGRIVVSTGTIKTHSSKINENNEVEWEIKTGKEAIIIEDAHPTVELSRKKKDKRVLGVLGLNTRNNSSPERMIINSIGEGGIWICNSNGNIENGDYITSSDYLGYGEKQDDDLLHNYTVAKATMDCDFELDNPLYNCIEIQEGLRIAFIAATYHCG